LDCYFVVFAKCIALPRTVFPIALGNKVMLGKKFFFTKRVFAENCDHDVPPVGPWDVCGTLARNKGFGLQTLAATIV